MYSNNSEREAEFEEISEAEIARHPIITAGAILANVRRVVWDTLPTSATEGEIRALVGELAGRVRRGEPLPETAGGFFAAARPFAGMGV